MRTVRRCKATDPNYSRPPATAWAIVLLFASLLGGCGPTVYPPLPPVRPIPTVDFVSAKPNLRSGMSQEEVLDLMGMPLEVSRNGTAADTWSYEDADTRIDIRFTADNELADVKEGKPDVVKAVAR